MIGVLDPYANDLFPLIPEVFVDRSPLREGETRPAPSAPQPQRPSGELLVDDTLEQTFPASDPPAWTLGRKAARRRDEPRPGDNEEVNETPTIEI